jgi:hypothetical protein
MEKLEEKLDFYYNAQGYMVLTGHYHLKKGYCCGHGCLHCPYEYAGVPEPRKSELLSTEAARTEVKKLL